MFHLRLLLCKNLFFGPFSIVPIAYSSRQEKNHDQPMIKLEYLHRKLQAQGILPQSDCLRDNEVRWLWSLQFSYFLYLFFLRHPQELLTRNIYVFFLLSRPMSKMIFWDSKAPMNRFCRDLGLLLKVFFFVLKTVWRFCRLFFCFSSFLMSKFFKLLWLSMEREDSLTSSGASIGKKGRCYSLFLSYTTLQSV